MTTYRSSKKIALIGISIASFMGCIDFTIVNTALPAIQSYFQVGLGTLQWIINIFILALSACMVLAGRLADLYGRRRVLYIGMLLFALASLSAGLSENFTQLIVCRFLQGLSCCVLYTATGALVAQIFPIEERGRAMGVLFGVNALGLAIGPVLGGLIVGAIGWRWIFFINLPLTLISFILCTASLPHSEALDKHQRIDVWGALLLISTLVTLVLGLNALTREGALTWDNGFLLASTLICCVIFYQVEKRVAEPILDLSLFKNRVFLAGTIATFSLAFFYCVAFFLIPLYLHNIRGESDYGVGFALLPITGTIAIVSPFIGKYVDKHGAYLPLLIGFIFFALAAILQTHFSQHDSLLYVLSAFVLMGLGWACVLGPSTVLALSQLPEARSGLAMGASWTLHNIGGVVGLAAGLALYNMKVGAHHNFLTGFQADFYLLAFTALLTFSVLLWLFCSIKK